MSHSIPEPQAVLIKTKIGNLLHTGDWKIDRSPQIGAPIDEARLRALGDDGLLALIGDSTNALEAGYADSEDCVKAGLLDVIARQDRRVVVGCFATNVARVQSLGRVAQATGRSLVLVGRSLHRVTAAAKAAGYLNDLPEIVPESQMADLPPDKVLMIATGSQGEERAALGRMAWERHPTAFVEAGDTVIFSSRVIPGNELAVGNIQNAFVKRGVLVVTEGGVDEMVHATGHAMASELAAILDWTRPRYVLPVHGEWKHMVEHAKLAEGHQVFKALVGGNGAVVSIKQEDAKIIDHVYSGSLALDGDRLIDPKGPVLPQRRRLARTGTVSVAVALDKKGRLLGEIGVEAYGSLDPDVDSGVLKSLRSRVSEQLSKLSKTESDERKSIEKMIVSVAKRVFHDYTGKKPLTMVHVIRV